MALIPKDLQRFRIDGTTVTPQYIRPTATVLQTAEQILDCFRISPQDTYGALTDALEPLYFESQRHRLIRGLIHILEDRLTFDESPAISPVELRKTLFERAGKIRADEYESLTWRSQILSQVAHETGIDAQDIEACLYADLKSERRITAFEDLTPEHLIALYNMALAKSLLAYARSLVFTIVFDTESSQGIRRLFQHLRFFNLLFDARPIVESTWQFTVDGPSAVLPQPQKYATELASFLPSLFAFSSWHATANVTLDGKQVTWQLKPNDFEPPPMVFPERIPVEANQLASRIQELDPTLHVHRQTPIVPMGPQCIWIPDFTIQNTVTQKEVHVEVLGVWRADYLNRRLTQLAQLKSYPNNFILVLSDKLKIDAESMQKTHIPVVTFKRTPRPQDLIARAQKLTR